MVIAGNIVSWAIIALVCCYNIVALVPAALALSFGGHCARCNIKHSLPTTDEARQAALELRDRMIESGRIDVDELPVQESPVQQRTANDDANNINYNNDKNGRVDDLDIDSDLDPALAIDRLYERRGKMFGVLVCEKVPDSTLDSIVESSNSNSADDHNNNVVILKAYAGKLGGQWNLPGWAPLVGQVPEDIPMFRRISAEVTELFERIDNVAANADEDDVAVADEVRRLTKERARLSTRCIDEIKNHQLMTNFRGETLPITAIFNKGPTKLPGGTGDCAAPKLLAEAVRLGLRPTGICEIFIGATGGMSTTKGDGKFYDACEQRCEQIAGYMLCGLHAGDANE